MNNPFLKSMTAYGRASQNHLLGRFVLEIYTVNRKYLEVNLSLPKELLRFEIEMRKWTSENIARGQVTINLSFRADQSQIFKIVPNLSFAKSLKNAWNQIANEVGVEINSPSYLSLLAEHKELFYSEEMVDENLFRSILKQVFEEAIEKLDFMKKKEGELVALDIKKRVESLKKIMSEIENCCPEATKKYYQKIKQRLEEIFGQTLENEEKILREIAIFAEKVDIVEEVTRFKSHLIQFDHFLNNSSEPPGKTLDFLIQELNREVNTIGSKASDALISQLVVKAKSELEKIREQIQNIE